MAIGTGNISLDEVRLYLELSTTASLQNCFSASVDSYFDPIYSGSKNSLGSFRGYNTTVTTVYTWLAVENGTATFALPITGSIIYEGNIFTGVSGTIFISETTIPTSSTNSVSVNRIYYSDTPFHAMDAGDNNIMVPFSLKGRLFGNYSSRYGTSTFYLYSLLGSASVDVFENTGVNGTPTTTISVADNFRSTYTYASDTWIFFSSSADIIMSVEEASGDKHLMPPAATSIYRRRDNNERTVNNTTPSTISAYIVSDSLPVVAVEIGDGAGGDSSQGMGLANMATDYFFGMELSDFHIVTPYQTEVKVYYYNGSWNLGDTISLTGSLASPAAAFREGNTGFGSEGNLSIDSGGASYLASGAILWWFKGDNPFMVTINDTSDDEEILVGANDTRTPQITTPTPTPTPTTTPTPTPTPTPSPSVPAGDITLVTSGGFITPLDQSSLTITGIQSGDFVIIAGASDSEPMTVPSGWTEGFIDNGVNSSTRGGYIYAFSTGTSITASSLAGTGTGGFSYGYIYQVFRGVNQSNPINAQAGTASGGDASPNPPSITTTVNRCMIVAMGMLDDDTSASSVLAPTGFTLIAAQDADQYATVMTAYLLQETAGTIDPDAFTSSPDNRIAITVALEPA